MNSSILRGLRTFRFSGRLRRAFIAAPILATLAAGCVENSTTPVVFDQVLQSASFQNRLLAPIVIWRNDSLLDTLPALQSITVPIGRKGVFKYRWQLISPKDAFGNPLGIQPAVDLGVQYQIAQNFEINNSSVNGQTIFTPRIVNAGHYHYQVIVNYQESDQFNTNIILGPGEQLYSQNAPYYYWNSSSNVYLLGKDTFLDYEFSRSDTTVSNHLDLDSYSGSTGTGISTPIVIPY